MRSAEDDASTATCGLCEGTRSDDSTSSGADVSQLKSEETGISLHPQS